MTLKNQPVSSSSNNYLDKFIPDILLLILAFFCTDYLMQWQLQHLVLSCSLLMILNTIAVSLGCFNFFTAYADMGSLLAYRDSLTSFEKTCFGLSAFISCVGFLWWLVPFNVAKTMGVKETGFIFGMVVYFICFMGVVAGSIDSKKGLLMQRSPLLKTAGSFINGFFFFFSYVFLLVTLSRWNPTFIGARFAAIICLTAFYLPLRFFLLLRPPFHKLEYLIFIFSFCYMLYKLFVVI